jgi:hypothetical protein
MVKNDNKTQQTSQSPEDFIASVGHSGRRHDARRLLDIFSDATGLAPRMWGPSIIGYGRYHYKYESGRQGDFMLTGFSPRQSNLSLYIIPGYENLQDKLDRLGKHKTGKSCLYINRLADIDEAVLREIIEYDIQYMRARYETWEE